jgi:hypothetical protein
MMDDFGNTFYDWLTKPESAAAFIRFTLSDEAIAARTRDEDLRQYGVIA